MFFEAARNASTRGHQYKLFRGQQGALVVDSLALGFTVVDSWNKHRTQTLEARTVEEFKIALESEGY